jgi:hypothetical protein
MRGVLVYSLLAIAGCAYYPPNHSPNFSVPGKSGGPTINLPPVLLSNDGNPGAYRLGASEYARFNSAFSYDLNFHSGDFFLSPSVYLLGIGTGVGYQYHNRTSVAVNSGMGILPVSYSAGVSVSQRIHNRAYFTYGFNVASLHKVDCSGICMMENTSKAAPYHHFSVLFMNTDFRFIDIHVDYMKGGETDLEPGVTLGFTEEIFK